MKGHGHHYRRHRKSFGESLMGALGRILINVISAIIVLSIVMGVMGTLLVGAFI